MVLDEQKKVSFILIAVFLACASILFFGDELKISEKNMITGSAIHNPDNWVDSNCQHRMKLMFNNSASSSNLVDFPALIKLTPARINYSQTSAADIRFYDNSTLLYKETELWNSTGDSFIWVKVPQIDNTNSDYIFAYYGCSDTNNDDAANVWNSNFMMVQHLEETSGTIYDSTSNNNDGTPNGPTPSSGKINGAYDFDGVNDYALIPNNPSLNFGSNSFSYMFWFKSRANSTQYFITKKASTLSTTPSGYMAGIASSPTTGFSATIADGSNHMRVNTSTHPAWGGNVWTMFSVVVDRSQQKMLVYINGAHIKNASISSVGNVNSSMNLTIGKQGDSSAAYFNGGMDEVQVLNTALNPDWVRASYLSMNDQFANFYLEEEQEASLILTVTSPAATTYDSTTVLLEGTTSANANISYSLDGSANVSVANDVQSFSTNLTGLSYGDHTIIVYAAANSVDYEEINFTVAQPAGWEDNNCQQRLKLTFNNSFSSSNLADFPVLVKLTPERINYSQTSAADIRFYDNSTLLYKETELWNSTGDSFIWVKVPQIDNTNSDYIFAYYGCSNTNNDDAENVWNSYVLVQHFEEISGTVYDSTSYHNDGMLGNGSSQTSPTTGAEGIVNGAFYFDSSDCVPIPHNNSLNLGTGDFMISAWMKYSNAPDADIIRKGNTQSAPEANYKMEVSGYTLNKISGTLQGSNPGGTGSVIETTAAYNDNQWHNAVYMRQSGTLSLYVDGILIGTSSNANIDLTNNASMSIGSKDGCDDDHFNGSIDEVRISKTARSTDWIKASYRSGRDEFIIYNQAEQPAPECGNGIKESGEECDDENTNPGDGCSSNCMFEFYNCTDDSSMTSYWKFEEGSGTIVNDAVDANTGIANGPAWSAGKVGMALDFDGTNDYTDVLHDDSLNFGTGDFAIAVWIKYSSQSGDPDIMRKGNMNNAGSAANYKIELVNNKISATVQGSSFPAVTVETTETYGDNEWHNVVFQRVSGTIYLYVDGDLEDSQTGATLDLTNSANMSIGAKDDHTEDFFNGAIDELAVYHRALSPAEVSNSYQKGLSDYGYCEISQKCGDNVVQPGEECDGGNCCYANCTFKAVGFSCADDMACNGDETCDGAGRCQPGKPLNCDDGVGCTDDSCNESTDSCDHAANNASCDDGLFCNGVDYCAGASGCQIIPTAINDSVDCTIDNCNETSDIITHTADNSYCLNGLWCDGAETCDAAEGCKSGSAPYCDDGISCTSNSCSEGTAYDDNLGTCEYNTSSCQCTTNAQCDDSNPCTDDACNAQKTCEHANDDSNGCDDGFFCTENDRCSAGICTADQKSVNDSVSCTVDSCDETNDIMVHNPSNLLCSDGLYCNGAETCDATLDCQAGIAPKIDDNNTCTADSCDEVNDTIVNSIIDSDKDGFDVCDDCNDTNANINPNATDVCGNGIDEDCSGSDARCSGGGGGGGGAGGGSARECVLSDWTCSAWGDCIGEVQRRTCTKIANCYDTGKNRPEMLRTCTMPSTGGEVQQPALIVTQPNATVEQPQPTAPAPKKLTMWDQLKSNLMFWLLLIIVLLALIYFGFFEKKSNKYGIIAKNKKHKNK